MLKNYVAVAWRNLRRYWVVSLINALGLGMGIACSIAILIFVLGELSYDRWNEHADQIYRAHLDGVLGTTEIHTATSAAPLATVMTRDFPEVSSATRLYRGRGSAIIRIGGELVREQRTAVIASMFSLLAILIACLGLFGLASLIAENRTKEIGIRKVLGATATDIVSLLTKEFIARVLLALVIAWPIAYVLMDRWLQDYAYRVSIGFRSFVYAGGLALAVACITVCCQAVKAACINPVENLRYE